MKYFCTKCKQNIWVMIPITRCVICKTATVELVSQLNYENSDVDVTIRMSSTFHESLQTVPKEND